MQYERRPDLEGIATLKPDDKSDIDSIREAVMGKAKDAENI